MPDTKNRDWEEEFDKEFNSYQAFKNYKTSDERINIVSADGERIKEFFRRLLAEADIKARREQHRLAVAEVEKRQKRECENDEKCFTDVHQSCCTPCVYYQSALSALDRVKPESRKE